MFYLRFVCGLHVQSADLLHNNYTVCLTLVNPGIDDTFVQLLIPTGHVLSLFLCCSHSVLVLCHVNVEADCQVIPHNTEPLMRQITCFSATSVCLNPDHISENPNR